MNSLPMKSGHMLARTNARFPATVANGDGVVTPSLGYAATAAARATRSRPKMWSSSGRLLVTPSYDEQGGGMDEADPASCVEAYKRILTPEALMGDVDSDPSAYVLDRPRALPSFLTNADPDAIAVNFQDYNVVGTVGQSRAVLSTLYSAFHQDVSVTQMTVSGVTATATFSTAAADLPGTAGFLLRWGIALNNFAPFDLNISTAGWVSRFGGDVANRNISIHVSNVIGSDLYIPWAVRVSPAMSMAQHVIAYAPQSDVTNGVITVSNIPAALATNFSASLQFLSAFSPATAAFARGMDLY